MPDPSPSAVGRSPRSPWRGRIGWLGAAALGAVLLVAAAGKLLDPAAFARQIAAEGLAFVLPAGFWAVLMVALEVGLGVALLLGWRDRGVLGVATALVALFLVLTGRAAGRHLAGLPPLDPGGCGCFGALVERGPGEAFLQDLALLVPTLALAWWGRQGPGVGRRTAARISGAAFVAAALFAAASPRLPLDDLATALRPGAELAAICAGDPPARLCLTDLAPDLATGRHRVVVGDPDDPELAAAVPALNAAAETGGDPLTLLADLAPDEERRLFFLWAPAFSLRAVPPELLRKLYRDLPRSFVVEEGRVVATHRGLPPGIPARPTAGETVP